MEEAIIKTAALTLSSFTFITYLAFSYSKMGITKSISDSFMHHKEGDRKYFPLFTNLMALPLVVFCIDKPILLIAIFLIALIGAFPYLSNKKVKTIHLITAGLGVFLFLFGIWHYHKVMYPLVITVAAGILLLAFNIKNKLYIGEVITFILIALFLFTTIVY